MSRKGECKKETKKGEIKKDIRAIRNQSQTWFPLYLCKTLLHRITRHTRSCCTLMQLHHKTNFIKLFHRMLETGGKWKYPFKSSEEHSS